MLRHGVYVGLFNCWHISFLLLAFDWGWLWGCVLLGSVWCLMGILGLYDHEATIITVIRISIIQVGFPRGLGSFCWR